MVILIFSDVQGDVAYANPLLASSSSVIGCIVVSLHTGEGLLSKNVAPE